MHICKTGSEKFFLDFLSYTRKSKIKLQYNLTNSKSKIALFYATKHVYIYIYINIAIIRMH